MGAHDCVLNGPGHDAVARVKQLTGGYGADVVIEAVGKPDTWELAVQLLRRGGTVNFFGGCPADTRVSLDTGLLHYSEMKCLASFHHTPAIIRKALEIVSRGEITAKDFVKQEEPLTSLNSVLRHLMSHNGHMKTAIIP
jgi:L-iditol 2-dehydrogenase